jgi:hypothetical protein
VFGWEATVKTAAYLLLSTLVNLTTLALFSFAMFTRDAGEKNLPRFDPTDPESLILSSDTTGALLQTSTADPKNRGPGDAKVAFGRNNTNEVVRLWVPAEVEVSVFMANLCTVLTINLSATIGNTTVRFGFRNT